MKTLGRAIRLPIAGRTQDEGPLTHGAVNEVQFPGIARNGRNTPCEQSVSAADARVQPRVRLLPCGVFSRTQACRLVWSRVVVGGRWEGICECEG